MSENDRDRTALGKTFRYMQQPPTIIEYLPPQSITYKQKDSKLHFICTSICNNSIAPQMILKHIMRDGLWQPFRTQKTGNFPKASSKLKTPCWYVFTTTAFQRREGKQYFIQELYLPSLSVIAQCFSRAVEKKRGIFIMHRGFFSFGEVFNSTLHLEGSILAWSCQFCSQRKNANIMTT